MQESNQERRSKNFFEVLLLKVWMLMGYKLQLIWKSRAAIHILNLEVLINFEVWMKFYDLVLKNKIKKYKGKRKASKTVFPKKKKKPNNFEIPKQKNQTIYIYIYDF